MMKKTTDIEAYAALDFEASSLAPDSWPIEIGLSWLKDDIVHTWSSLIRPALDWNLSAWSTQSAAVHGLALEALHYAPTASTVVDEFLERLEGKVPLSDAPEFDARWLSRLLQAGGCASVPEVEDYHCVSFAHFSGLALDMLYEYLGRHPAPHRAGPDSARLVRAWRKAQQY
ncbi:hypothetical protein [Primorskyibacter flagellatus]|uniref:DNA polymerase III, epsilon subunit n=1 Tax=Primorskyibacter flagellatus TaxID=1387277 RepID=A0A1W1ZGJ6_9RHOB|nr:hypothetical protein [Primorskyibacter flagellatus]SMC47524.1 DNA polymerase III, epsilon subunit [Primorskyibacter flagellatus]